MTEDSQILPLNNEAEEPKELNQIISNPTEGFAFEGEEYSDGETERDPKPKLSKQSDNVDMLDVIVKKKGSRKQSNLSLPQSNYSRSNTLCLNTNKSSISPLDVNRNIKIHTNFISRLLLKYREDDEKEYNKFIKYKVFDQEVKMIFHRFYLLHKRFAEQTLIYFLNSYDEAGLCRIFQEFYLKFDENNDRKMQKEELEKCIEFLAKEDALGSKKVLDAFKEIGIDCESSFRFIEEGNANKILNEEGLSNIFKALKVKNSSVKKNPKLDHVDFLKFAPLIVLFFLENMIANCLKKREIYYTYLGFPHKINSIGKAEIIPKGTPSGLYRIFVKQLKGQSDIKAEIVSYDDVSQGLISYKASGRSNSLTSKGINRIMKQIKDIMSVNPVTSLEAKKCSLKEILPDITCKVITEMTWNKGKFPMSIMKYDKMVEWYGCAYPKKINKKTLHREIDDAFAYLRFPNFNQFVKGLNFVLKKLIPTLSSPVAIFLAKKLSKTPNIIINEDGYNGEVDIKFNIREIIANDNLFNRLSYFSLKTQLKLMFVRLLYKNFYLNYKTDKGIVDTLSRFYTIINTPDLFEGMNPGKYGNFEDEKLQMLKVIDPKIAEREENEKIEKRKKMFIQRLIDNYNYIEEKKESRGSIKKQKKLFIPAEPEIDEEHQRLIYQAEANTIDRNIQIKENKKKQKKEKIKVNSAFPSDERITPEIMLSIIVNSKNQSKEIKELQDYIKRNQDTISYEDIQKHIVSEHLKKSGCKDHELAKIGETKYLSKDMNEEINKYNKNKRKFRSISPIIRKKDSNNASLNNSAISEELETSKSEDDSENEVEDLRDENLYYDDVAQFEEEYFQDIMNKTKQLEVLRYQKLNQAFIGKENERECRCSCDCIVF